MEIQNATANDHEPDEKENCKKTRLPKRIVKPKRMVKRMRARSSSQWITINAMTTAARRVKRAATMMVREKRKRQKKTPEYDEDFVLPHPDVEPFPNAHRFPVRVRKARVMKSM